MFKLKGVIAAIVMAFVVSAQLLAADKDAFLNHLSGHWVLTGTIGKQATTYDVQGEWVLQNRYLRLTEISREKDATGKPQYEAVVLLAFDPAKQHFVCFWFDTTGIAATTDGGSAVREGDSLPFVFKSPDGDFFNTMTYDAKADVWLWEMDGEVKGERKLFARLTLKRP